MPRLPFTRRTPPPPAEPARAQDYSGGLYGGNAGPSGVGGYGPLGGYQLGGPRFQNLTTGQGTSLDKSMQGHFTPRILTPLEAETLYQQSWAVKKMLDIPVDDMWARGLMWEDDDEDKVRMMEEVCIELGLQRALSGAIKASMMFGSGLLVVVPKTGDMEKPMPDYGMIPEGGIANLLVIDRWSASINAVGEDPRMPGYGMPYTYRLALRSGGASDMVVHADYVHRFDGIRAPMTEGWRTGVWERMWGTSFLSAVVEEVVRDAAINGGVGQLVQEASVWVMKIQNLKEALRGRPVPGEPTADEIGMQTNLLRSIYRTQFVDREDEVQRVAVNFGSLPELLNQQAVRLAAMGDIPFTRFMSQSPGGLNATGASDASNYALKVASDQKNKLDIPLRKINMALARHAGLEKPPEYRWLPLVDRDEKMAAEAVRIATGAVVETFVAGLIDEAEARERLSNIDFWGELGDWSPSASLQMEQEREDERAMERTKMMMDKPAPAPVVR